MERIFLQGSERKPENGGMAMGTRKQQERQEDLWIAAAELPRSAGHPFYEGLNELLEQAGFDRFVEERCRRFYAAKMGRPSLAPGVYFRLLLVGYFEGLDSERGIAWRAADSLGLRRFLRVGLDEMAPDHSTISRTRRLIDVETHREVFTWALGVIAEKGLLKGKTVGIDATTLEANAALRSIVRRDSGESYQEFLTKLAKESGIATPTREDLARLDRKRKKRKTSNKEWMSPHDEDARITKMKDKRTHLAHKAEHAVDLETGAVVAVTLQGADRGDTTTVKETFIEAAEQLEEVGKEAAADERMNAQGLQEVVADKGYHSGARLVDLREIGVRSYIPEPKRKRRHWKGKAGERAAVYANRRRIRGERGKQLLRRRGELVERSFAHVYDTGGMRRTHLRGHRNILKRLLIHVAAFNLSLILRQQLGVGTPRSLQGLRNRLFFRLWLVWTVLERLRKGSARQPAQSSGRSRFLLLPDQTLSAA
jgi:transposase